MTEPQSPDLMNALRDLCLQMVTAQAEVERIEDLSKAAKAVFDDLRLIQAPELLEKLGVRNATFEGIGRIQLAADIQCSTLAGRKLEAAQWLKDSGYADMVKEDYNATSVKALVKRLMLEGAEIPDFFTIYPFQRASIVKA